MDKYFEMIKEYKRLNLEEAQTLYREILETKDSSRKIKLRDELIKSTLYVVINYVKTNCLEIFESSSFDIDDIVSTSIEFFIKEIDDGRLLELKTYAHMFGSRYYTYLERYLTNTNYVGDLYPTDILNVDDFKELFYIYLILKEKNEIINKEEFINEINKRKLTFNFRYKGDISKELDKIIYVFENIYNTHPFDEFAVSRRLLGNTRLLLFANAINIPIKNDHPSDMSVENMTIRKILYENVADIYNTRLTKKQQEVINLHFGLTDNEKAYLTIAQETNRTVEGIRNIEFQGLKKFENDKKLSRFAKEVIKEM